MPVGRAMPSREARAHRPVKDVEVGAVLDFGDESQVVGACRSHPQPRRLFAWHPLPGSRRSSPGPLGLAPLARDGAALRLPGLAAPRNCSEQGSPSVYIKEERNRAPLTDTAALREHVEFAHDPTGYRQIAEVKVE